MDSLWSVGNKEISKRQSKISLPSVGIVCANKPPAVMLRSREDFVSKPEQKMSNDTSLGINKSRLDAKRCKNLAHAAPIDSFSNCSNLRIYISRESMHSERENE